MATITSPEQAQQVLFEQVFIPAFIQKLASHKIAPRNDADLREMLKIADTLNAAAAGGLAEAVAPEVDADPFLKSASLNLTSIVKEANRKAQIAPAIAEAAALLVGTASK
jgi:hypothetical protein